MSTSWINFLYKHITGEEDNERASSSLDVLSKDLPTNNLEPIEESFGARRTTMKGKEEMELQLEEKMAVFEQQYLEREKELIEKNYALEKELKESRESLETEIKDLKETLAIREKRHKEQKEVFKKMATYAKSELNKAQGVISNLSEGMKACEAALSVSKETISENEHKIKQLTSQKETYKYVTKSMTADIRRYNTQLQRAADDVDKIRERLEFYKADNSQLLRQNSFLQNQVEELKEDLKKTNGDNYQKQQLLSQNSFLQNQVEELREDLKKTNGDNYQKQQLLSQNSFLQNQVEELKEDLKKANDDNYQKQLIVMETLVVNAETKLKEFSEVNSKLVKKISFLQSEDKKVTQFDLHEERNRERLEEKLERINQLNHDLNKIHTEVTIEILAGVYDDLEFTQLDVTSWAYFVPQQKNPLLIKETKGDEANAKKTEKVEVDSEPRSSMLSSATSSPISGTFTPETCLRKRIRSGQNKGFCCKSKIADVLSMPTADEDGPIRLHQAPLPPITSLSTSEVGRVKKDDDWLDMIQDNFVPVSQKGNTPINTPATASQVPCSVENDDQLPQGQESCKTPRKTGFLAPGPSLQLSIVTKVSRNDSVTI